MDLKESSSKRNLFITHDDDSEFNIDWLNEGVDNIGLTPHRSVSWYTASSLDEDMASVPLRETRSHTGTIEDSNQAKLARLGSLVKTDLPQSGLQTEYPPNEAASCPCGCLQRPAKEPIFRTREASTMKLYTAGRELLQYQGRTYCPELIAPIWKKDCRSWLWKSMTSAYKNQNEPPADK